MCHFTSFGKKIVSSRLKPNQEAHLKTLIKIPFYTLIIKILLENLWLDINRVQRLIVIFRYSCKRNIRNRLICLSTQKVAKKALQ